MTVRTIRTAGVRCALFLIIGLASCKKEGGTPSFLRIESPKAKTVSNGQVITSAITDLWVYSKGEPVGVWQPGRRIPVLSDGTTKITLIAGVKRNGISDDRIQYPFMATLEQDVDLSAAQETSIQPVFTYYEDASWTQDFESTGYNFDFSEGDTTFVSINADTDSAEVLTGAGAAAIVLDPAHDLFRATSLADPPFPSGTTPAFLELDVRSDTRLLVGVKYVLGGQLFTVPYVYLNSTQEYDGDLAWTHFYIDLRTAWGAGLITSRGFYLEAKLENGATNARIVLDNLRVYY